MSFGLDPFSGASGQTSGTGPSGPPFSLDAMSALISAQEQSGTSGLSPMQQKVFGQLDADGDGTVTGSELQSAFGADNKDAADYVMSKLDTNGDGSISQSEFASGTTKGAGHHHHHMHAGPPPDASQGDPSTQGTQDPLSALLSSSASGASSQTESNSDGSSTTTITYADGSKISMTSAASSSGTASGATSSSGSSLSQTQQNLLEQLIKLQSQLVQNMSASSTATTSLATI